MTDINTDHAANIMDNLIHQLSTAIVVVDAATCVVACNAAAETLLDCSQRRLTGIQFHQLFAYCSFSEDNIRRCLSDEQSFSDSEVVITLPNGEHHDIAMSVSALKSQGRDYALIECRAIENQKRISQDNFQQQQLAASRDLVRGLAHEIKNPLGGLRGAAQLLEKQLASPELKEFTGMIIEQADRLRNLVDRLLGPNKVPNRVHQNIHQVLEKVRFLIEHDNSSDVVIDRDYDPSIPDIDFDSDQLHQAILNIVVNAVQALDGKGRVVLKTRIAGQMTINSKHFKQTIAVSIIDNGPGISPQIRDTLFYPMVTNKDGGSGLGLSIAQTLVAQHNGRIDCNSHPGGTEFIIYLPIK